MGTLRSRKWCERIRTKNPLASSNASPISKALMPETIPSQIEYADQLDQSISLPDAEH